MRNSYLLLNLSAICYSSVDCCICAFVQGSTIHNQITPIAVGVAK